MGWFIKESAQAENLDLQLDPPIIIRLKLH